MRSIWNRLLARSPGKKAGDVDRLGDCENRTEVPSYRASIDEAPSSATHEPHPSTAQERPLPKDRYALAPSDLEVTDIGPKNALLIGACFLFEWADFLKNRGYSDLNLDRILFYQAAQLPAEPPRPIESYDVQLVQIPLPSIMPDQEYFRLPADKPELFESLLDASVRRLELFLNEALVWSDRVPTFVMTYLTPQQNLAGRLLPRYDIRNPIHFIERLNIEMDRLLKQYRNVHLIDTNHIASVYGRRFMQEDAFWNQHHGGLLSTTSDEIWDGGKRIEKSLSAAEVHGADVEGFVEMVWLEIRAAYRTLKRADEVKMVCIDLDDTLWRGVIGEMSEADIANVRGYLFAGWPLGLVEVLQFLKRRGIILAIISKNDEARIRALWHKIYDEGHIRIEDFGIVKINWRPKAENIAEAIAEANILPKNVVFLDDNPVERAAVKAAFPEIRVIAASHLRWGRILGWSPELQVAEISNESARRTEMIQAQVERQRARTTLSREEFLTSLELRIAVNPVRSVTDSRFARAFELINKTNQFNTTGVRWSDRDAATYLEGGGVWWTFEITDRFTSYGLVGVVCIRQLQVDQFVMSCRVAGLDAELAAFSVILQQSAAPGTQFEGIIRPNENNAVSRDIFERLGWQEIGGVWRGGAPATQPVHVKVLKAA